MAPAADVFLMIGTYKYDEELHLLLRLPIQCKHYESHALTKVKMGSEWYKCGSRCKIACLAEIVDRIRSPDDVGKQIQSVLKEVRVDATELSAFEATIVALVKQDKKLPKKKQLFGGRGIERGKVMSLLEAKAELSTLLRNVDDQCNDAMLICLSTKPLPLTPVKGFVNVTMEKPDDVLSAADALYPVVQSDLATNNVVDWTSVLLV
jgi:hypothetical protein